MYTTSGIVPMEYKQKLLTQWEEVYKKGQLTFWILVSLVDQPRELEEIKLFIEDATAGHMSSQDQSLYRALRKFVEVELVDYTEQKGHRGPKRKLYNLTELGRELVTLFAQRNIPPLHHATIQQLIQEKA